MNPQILKLAEQAGWMMSDEVEGFNIRLERFAELIVGECTKIATNPYLNDEESYYGNEFAKAIKQHFGVRD